MQGSTDKQRIKPKGEQGSYEFKRARDERQKRQAAHGKARRIQKMKGRKV